MPCDSEGAVHGAAPAGAAASRCGVGIRADRTAMRAPLAVLAAALAACGGGSGGHQGDVPPPSDPCALDTPGAAWLAFASHRTGDSEIWMARADGTCPAQVTHQPAPDLFPTWSGTRIVFESERGGVQGLWAHDLATGAETPVETGELASATSPAFSPDGTRLAFEGRAAGASTSDVYVVPASGGPASTLEAVPAGGGGPAWAPDGQTVYFVSLRTGSYEVWAVPAAGGDAVRVTTASRIVGKPGVTADGASIVYARTIAGSSSTEVVRQELATGTVSIVSSLDDSEPALSPDGRRVAVRSFRTGHPDLLVEELDGSGAIPVTADVASDGAPTFAVMP